LTLGGIESILTTRSLGRRIELRNRIDSTNREAVALGQADAEHGTVVLADSQTAGRGRLGREWFSPPGINLYASVVIRTTLDTQRLSQWLSWLPLMTAMGAAEAIEAVAAARVALKWPNDLLIGDRKIGGILCESGTSTRLGPFQVTGIGINVNGERANFPGELREVATSIRQETGQEIDRNRLLVRLLEELEVCLEEFLAHGTERIALAYRRRCTTLGKTVKAVLADGNEYIGTAEGIGPDGSLTLVQEPARPGLPFEVRRLRAADITHLR
jgi:BirA family transcriptional regulator, biotin operon repressor / biotin---[acetyl-CoA-carboxylase] ligase